MKDLKDRVAVVTGAASGIGRALSAQLAQAGCRVALVDVDPAGLDSLGEALRGQGHAVSIHPLDVRDRQVLAALPDQVVAEHGHVHLLVNNAGVALSGPLLENTEEDLDWIIDINFWGVVLGCKYFLPHLLKEDEGHIVNLSSMFGLIGLPTVGAYCATKAAVRSYSETLGAELRESRITVTSVHPGGVATNIMKSARMTDESDRSEAVNSFERFGITPERAAHRIVGAIRRDKTRLRIGWETYLTDWLKRLAPVTLNKVVGLSYGRGERRRAAGGQSAAPQASD